MGRNMSRALLSPTPTPVLPSSAHPQSSIISYGSFLTPRQTEPSFHPENGKCRPGLSNWFNVTPGFSLEILISEVRRFMPRGDLVNICYLEKYMNFGKFPWEKIGAVFLCLHQLSIYSRPAYPVCVLFIFLILLSLTVYLYSHFNALRTFIVAWQRNTFHYLTVKYQNMERNLKS